MHALGGLVSTSISSRRWLVGAGAVVASLALAACSSSTPAASSKPGTAFSTRTISGLGAVVVDARGRTVYVLTADGRMNAPCSDASGCTATWPDLPLPDGVTAAKAGSGVQASLLSTMKLSDGETYPTYHGWLMYEYTGDSGSGQANGKGIQSFGGTWYPLSASGTLVK
jgi:predicted lipoprotein with Yx(FWY)xxD motif